MILRDLRYPRGHQVWEIEGGQEVRVPQETAQVREVSTGGVMELGQEGSVYGQGPGIGVFRLGKGSVGILAVSSSMGWGTGRGLLAQKDGPRRGGGPGALRVRGFDL